MPRALSDDDIADFRDRLIDAAEELFAEHGIEAVTMRELAARVGVSPMTPYRYFKDKDAFLAAVRARGFDRFAEDLESAQASAGAGVEERADAVGRAYIRFAFAHPQAYRLMFDIHQEHERDYPDLARASDRARATMTSYFNDPRTGEGRPDADLIGKVYWAALHGPIMLEFAGKLQPPNDAVAVIEAISRALWLGLPLAAGPGKEG